MVKKGVAIVLVLLFGGGMINFLIADNRLRFEIGWDATEQSRLKVSSRVLTPAITLHGTSKP